MAVFSSGYIVGRSEAFGTPVTPIRDWLVLTRVLGPAPERFESATPSPELEATFKPFWEAWGYVNREYYDEAALDSTKLSRGALRGMLGTLEDPYSLYLDPVHREMTEADLRGAFDGIGVQVEMVDESLKVISPLEGSSGQRAGILPNDIITHVDGRSLRGVSLTDSIGLIRGPRGTTVVLTIKRGDQPTFEVSVAREEVRVTAVRGEVRSDGIAYIRITNFTQRVGAELRQTLDRLADQPKRGWVLDLRGNPGGYLDGAIAVTSQFVDDRVVLYEQKRGDEREEIRTRGQGRATTGPMAVLIDKGTASASEIVAAALRDNGRATLVGEQSFGKGSVQLVHRLSDGSALRLTIARWLTPRGDPIQGIGLEPTVVVATAAGRDAVLQEAVDLVHGQANAAGIPVASPPSSRNTQGAPGATYRRAACAAPASAACSADDEARAASLNEAGTVEVTRAADTAPTAAADEGPIVILDGNERAAVSHKALV
jgi:carboxyl-terminal processing protease